MNNPGYGILFLDIGGVLLSNGWGTASRHEAARLFGFDYAEMNSRHAIIFNLFETGKISLDEYLEIAVFNQPRNFSVSEFKDFMYAQSTILPSFLPWLRDWKKKNAVKIIALNNEGKELNEHRIEKFGLTHCFDAFLSSCNTGMCKPDPGVFRLALSVAHLPPEACLYIDDTLVHVEVAGKMGIQAYQHKSFEETAKILEAVFTSYPQK
jgi:putative hydrolase of the HAD superfamily